MQCIYPALSQRARQPRCTNTAKKLSGFHDNTWHTLSKLSFVLKSALSQIRSWNFFDAQRTPGITNCVCVCGGCREKGIWWSMVTNHGRQIISCFPVSSALLSSPDRVGPNSRWCRREARTWDLQISVSLTSVPDRHEQQIPNLKSKFCFWFPHLCYYTWLFNKALCVLWQFQ